MCPGTDRAGPELDADRIAIDHTQSDRPLDAPGQFDRQRPRDLDHTRNALVAGIELLNMTGDAVTPAHVVASDVSFRRQGFEHAIGRASWRERGYQYV